MPRLGDSSQMSFFGRRTPLHPLCMRYESLNSCSIHDSPAVSDISWLGVIQMVSRPHNFLKSLSECSRFIQLTIVWLAVMPLRFPVKIQPNFVGSKTSEEVRLLSKHPLLFSNNSPLQSGPQWGGHVLLHVGRQVVFCESVPS